ncbi:MAG: hypothetical protein NWS20_00295 [Rickettsiaceae bacterium]|nr:hypothetical protein [Rickettsiaceae bacterium]
MNVANLYLNKEDDFDELVLDAPEDELEYDGVAMLSSDLALRLRWRTRFVTELCGRLNFGLGRVGGGGLAGASFLMPALLGRLTGTENSRSGVSNLFDKDWCCCCWWWRL